MKLLKRIVKFFLCAIALFVVLIVVAIVFHCMTDGADVPEKCVSNLTTAPIERSDSLVRLGNNYLQLNRFGLWEAYVEGGPYERGVALGRMERELMYYQERVFVEQINEMVPSRSYLSFLKHLILFFNRNLTDYIPEEYQQEIYGTTIESTHEFDYIGTPFERQLNYHAAHDLGHAMQDYMLVGCTSFGAWGGATADSSIIIGRNFDFYMGDDFARNKIVSFYRPLSGYPFAMVGWAGMTGVVSGMNVEGLTVTINAAKSDMPTSSATPISILARKILQYASTIDEAYRIADSMRTFVSESLLIGSKKDNRVVIIEKSTEQNSLFVSKENTIVCANHFQSEAFAEDKRNQENIATSDSPYRLARTEQLLSENLPLDVHKAISILRNTRGMNDTDIGMGNEKALNQLIAHHSVVFDATHLIMWVSTSPWQMGAFVAYDLKAIFNEKKEARVDSLFVPPSAEISSAEFVNFLKYRALRKKIRRLMSQGGEVTEVMADSLVMLNPNFYQAHDLSGDIYMKKGEKEKARKSWQYALQLEIPKKAEREVIERKLE